MSAKTIIKGTIILAASGIICRIMGFVFRIYVSRVMPASQIGLYQIVMPICVLGQAAAVGGMSTAVSRYTAGYRAQDKKDKGYINFLVTLLYCVTASAIIALIIGSNSEFISDVFLKNNRCIGLLVIAAYSLPFACIHSVIASYFVGLELPGLPAAAQIIEQLIRIICVFTVTGIYTQNSLVPDAKIALYGILAGEIGSALFTFLAVIFLNDKYKTEETGLVRTPVYYIGEGLLQLAKNIRMSLPITANRISLHLIQGLEAVLLPMMLMVYGMSNEEALSAYGILTGMTLPLVLFPATLTNSMSQALLPDIAKSWQTKNMPRLNKSVEIALSLAVNLGVMCIPGFVFYGSRFGMIIFDNEQVFRQVRLLCLICPFVFLSTPLSAMLNGMGKTGTVFLSNLLSHLFGLALVVFVVPYLGINGYCCGMIISHVLVCGWQMAYLKKTTGCHYSFKELIVKPVVRVTICFFATFPVYTLLTDFTSLPELACTICGGAAYITAVLLGNALTHDYNLPLPGRH